MSFSRRKFVKTLAGSGLVVSSLANNILQSRQMEELTYPEPDYSGLNDIRIGAIGMGIMGFNNCATSTKIPGVKLVGTCDLYQGRLDRSKEVFGSDLFTTRDYRELLARPDIDAVIISTTDHWHDRIAIDALKAGKHVYLEKPMVHRIEEGQALIDAEKASGKVVQVGSQRVSSLVYQKAREIYQSGVLGTLVAAEASFNRQSALGAWQYSIPTDASPETIDWDRFIGDAPKIPFDKTHFFRWRNYQAYGTGVAGDLFVHLFSGMHTVLSSHGPEKIYASGGLRYWEDGRDVPDVMYAIFDYPKTASHDAFNMSLMVNFVDGSSSGSKFVLIGSDGALEITGRELLLTTSKMSDAPGYGGWDSYNTFTEAQQKEYKAWYEAAFPNPAERVLVREESVFQQPRGFSENEAHHLNFYNAIAGKEKAIQDTTFGLRAAAPSLAANKSYFENKPIFWDPESMKLVEKS